MFLYIKVMPELPEVEITTRKLQPLIGKAIKSFWNDREVTARDITGRKVLRIKRLGKAIIFELSGNRILAFHQRMSGKLLILNKSDNRQTCLTRHIHARVGFNDDSKLLFHDPRKFGVVWYGQREKVFTDKYFTGLGPDALGITQSDFVLRMKDYRGGIKALLLNQHFLAGVGNIVADETLWQTKIHPQSKVEDINLAARGVLHSSLQAVLERSIKAQGTTLRDWGHPDGKQGGFQNHLKVYGRAGKPCHRCGKNIQRITCAGRGTAFCPKCQQC